MAGQSESPRMSVSLPVANHDIGTLPEPAQGCQNRGRLAERQQSGNIGESNGSTDGVLFDDDLVHRVPKDHAREAIFV